MICSFKDLSFEEILALAIRVEENNAQRLQTLVDLYTDYDRDLEAYFRRLYLEEIEHKKILVQRWSDRFGEKPFPEIKEKDVKEVVEAIDVIHGEQTISNDLTVDQALVIVYKAKTATYLFYLKAAAAVEDMEIKNLLSELASFEYQHIGNVPRFKPENEKSRIYE